MKVTSKQQALKDIKADLRKEGKCFIAFRKELTPAIENLVKQQIRKQKEI